MTAFMEYMGNLFGQIYYMMTSAAIAQYFNGISVFMLLVLFFFVWQIMYLYIVRPASMPSGVDLAIAHQNNVRSREEKQARELKAYREKRSTKYTVKYGKGGSHTVTSRYTQYNNKGDSITFVNPNAKAPDDFTEFE